MTRAATDASADIVERMGLLMEQDGLPRIAGRILGLLLIEPEACSLDEIAGTLGVSKASVSQDARRLERLGLVERVGRPGDRRDFYAIGPDMLSRAIAMRLDSMRRMQAILGDARRVPGATPSVRSRLAALERTHARVLRAVESLLADLRGGAADGGATSDKYSA